jgi:tripartite-type tricarboxylate transporter receptor subunit TctC
MIRGFRLLAALLCVLVACAAAAQTFPSRSIRVIVPFPAGGTADTIARIVSQRMSENVGQPIVVENRGGANGIVGTDVVAKSAPDGYTLLMAPSGHAINNSLNASVPYDPIKDFQMLTLIGTVPMVVVVNNEFPVKSIRELIDTAKAKPGAISYGSGGPGGSNHLAVELFSTMAGIKMLHIPYKGDTPGIADLLGGQIQMIFLNIPSALPLAKSGRVRAIGITGRSRSELLPDVPTIAETVPGYEAGSWHGFFAPAGTPAAVVATLSHELRKAINTPQVRDKLKADGVNVVASSPEEFTAFVKAEIDKWAQIIRTANVKL